ncbi:putative bifunctional diguanylate cyclase/phosphodiesterase [Acidocella sp.]|uniref:putative bifunctional diguanylate cyclase/phosphodiesterase n=1 Tax=Acidocella sp. TaxID=50710 RepID=UPI002F4006DE
MKGLKSFALRLHIPEDFAERLRLEQAKDFSRIIIAISLLGLSTTCLLFLEFQNEPHVLLHGALMLAVVLCYLALIARARSWLLCRDPTGADASLYIGRMMRLSALLGALWSILLILLLRHESGSQLALLYGVMVGCLVTPAMMSPLSCAVAYWLPISVGTVLALIAAPHPQILTLLALLSFIALTGGCIVFINQRLNERVIGTIRLEENAELIKLLLRDFEESSSDWLWETNAKMELQRVSPRLAQVVQRPAASLSGHFPDALLGEVMDSACHPDAQVERLRRVLEERLPFRDLVVPAVIAGEERYWSLTGKPIFDKFGRFAGYRGVGSDITGQRRQQEQIAFLARHDGLTKLANRVLFNEVLHHACETVAEAGVALLCLDLDQFKAVNDTLGHATGDAVLVAVAERLRGCLRERDVACRLGGDEFAIIVMSDDVTEIGAVAARIVERVSRPYQFDGQLVQIGTSIGISRAPQDGGDADALIKAADLALYRAKTDGRGLWRFYDLGMDERLRERRALQAALAQALPRGEFVLEYQPIVDLTDLRILGAEALLRWRHPERGLLAPDQFIAIAEEAGLIGPIGEWVMQQACLEAARWPEHIRIAVNLSPLQFRTAGLVETILQALHNAGVNPRRLELEITETAMLETSKQTTEALWDLHGKGVHIALDDFGTGYSSLSYLQRFPFDKIKIDRSFIRDLGHEKGDSLIILAIIGLAERLNMIATAEGVETSEQALLLTSYGCAQAQGHLFHRALPPETFAEAVAADMRIYDWQDAGFQLNA